MTLTPAAEAAGWAGGPPLSPPDRIAASARVALLPDGTRIVAWVQKTADLTVENVSVRVAPPTGDFGPVQTFPGSARQLRLATGPDGTAALAWATADQRIHVARRAPGDAAFTEATPLLVSESGAARELDAAVGGGNVYVAFDASSTLLQTTKSAIHVARLTAGETVVRDVVGTDGGLISRQQFTAPAPFRSVETPRIAVGSDGSVNVAYQSRGSSTGAGLGISSVGADTMPPGAMAFGAPTNVTFVQSRDASAAFVDIAIAAGGGHRYVVWDTGLAGTIAFRDLDGPLAPTPVPADPVSALRAGADGAGALHVGLTGTPTNFTADALSASVAAAGDAAQASKRLTVPGLDRRLDAFAVAPDGTTVAIANLDTQGLRTEPEALYRPAGGEFGPPERVSGLQDIPENQIETASAAVLPGGRAIVGWVGADHTTTPNARVHVSERDTTPPVIGAVAVPDGAVVGQPAGFAAAASDTLGGATLHWDFGDGSGADGNVVTHTFGEAGPATVTITATDDAGNSTSTTRVVAVTAPDVRRGPDGGGGGGGPSGPPPDTVAPVLRSAKLTNTRFRVAKKATAVLAGARKTKAAPVGTTFRLNVSERSTIAVAITRSKIVRGTLVRASVASGTVSIPFTGRLGKTALPAGSYSATITAIDGAGNRSKAVVVKFKIVKK